MLISALPSHPRSCFHQLRTTMTTMTGTLDQSFILDSNTKLSTIATALLYPTPSPSPTVSCPASPPRTNAQNAAVELTKQVPNVEDHLNPSFSSESSQDLSSRHASKKRKSPPQKAIAAFPKDPSTIGIVQLDVYNLYLLDPKSLVLRPSKIRKPAVVLPTPDTIDEAYISNDKRTISAPVAIDFDMSPYKITDGASAVLWKKGKINLLTLLGSCLAISADAPGYNQLTEEEIKTCSTLRMMPDQYLHIKQTILSAAETRGPFKKRDAKSWFRIDVNKTAVLFDWFRSLGWIPSDDEWEKRFKERASK